MELAASERGGNGLGLKNEGGGGISEIYDGDRPTTVAFWGYVRASRVQMKGTGGEGVIICDDPI